MIFRILFTNKLFFAKAFLCHRNNHWFTLRKLGTDWYDLNSLLPSPQQISVIGKHLSPFAEPALVQSYTGLFIVVGNLPQRHSLEEHKNNDKLQALPIEEEEELFSPLLPTVCLNNATQFPPHLSFGTKLLQDPPNWRRFAELIGLLNLYGQELANLTNEI